MGPGRATAEAYRDDAPQPVENLAVIATVKQALELNCGQGLRGDASVPGSLCSVKCELPG
jgi:hypothetical protein